MPSMPSAIAASAALTPVSGSAASSIGTTSTFLPRIPSPSFSLDAASCAPFSIPWPSTDCSPLSGASSPTRKVSFSPPPESEPPHPMARRRHSEDEAESCSEAGLRIHWFPSGGRLREFGDGPDRMRFRWPALHWARRGVAQPGSARPLGGRGPRFESGRPDFSARPRRRARVLAGVGSTLPAASTARTTIRWGPVPTWKPLGHGRQSPPSSRHWYVASGSGWKRKRASVRVGAVARVHSDPGVRRQRVVGVIDAFRAFRDLAEVIARLGVERGRLVFSHRDEDAGAAEARAGTVSSTGPSTSSSV